MKRQGQKRGTYGKAVGKSRAAINKIAKQNKELQEQKKAAWKSARVEVDRRVAIIHELKILGYHEHEILEYVNNGGRTGRDDTLRWGIKLGTVRYYATKSNAIAKEVLKANVKEHYEGAIQRWTMLIRKCHREGDNTNLVKATKELDELLGLRTKNINISGLLNVNDVTGMSDEQLDAAIAEAEAAVTKQLE